MGPDEMFEGILQRLEGVLQLCCNKAASVFGSRVEGRAEAWQHVYSCSVAPAGDCGSDCVSRWRDADSPISLTAPSHTQCHTLSHWPPCSQHPMQLAFFFVRFFLILCRNFTHVAVREQSYLKRRDYSHFNYTSTINLLLDNMPLLLSMIAVALPHLWATHFKVQKQNVHAHSSAFAYFFFFFLLHSMFTAWKSQDCILNVSVFYGPIQDFFFVCGALAVFSRSPVCCQEVRVDGDSKRFPPTEGAFVGWEPSVCSRGMSLSSMFKGWRQNVNKWAAEPALNSSTSTADKLGE